MLTGKKQQAHIRTSCGSSTGWIESHSPTVALTPSIKSFAAKVKPAQCFQVANLTFLHLVCVIVDDFCRDELLVTPRQPAFWTVNKVSVKD